MQQLRADLWCAAFVGRHNDLGRVCVLSRRGDPVAGQVFVEVDHLDGTVSLFTPAPVLARPEHGADRYFQRRLDHAAPQEVAGRIARELDFDPDLWVITLELRGDDHGLDIVET